MANWEAGLTEPHQPPGSLAVSTVQCWAGMLRPAQPCLEQSLGAVGPRGCDLSQGSSLQLKPALGKSVSVNSS